LPLDDNAANDVVSITKSKTAKRKQNSGASSSTSKKQNKCSWSAEHMSKNCCVGLYQGIHYAMRVIDHSIEITDHGIEITDHNIEMQQAKAQ
jgi:hypothetical protein